MNNNHMNIIFYYYLIVNLLFIYTKHLAKKRVRIWLLPPHTQDNLHVVDIIMFSGPVIEAVLVYCDFNIFIRWIVEADLLCENTGPCTMYVESLGQRDTVCKSLQHRESYLNHQIINYSQM